MVSDTPAEQQIVAMEADGYAPEVVSVVGLAKNRHNLAKPI